LFLRVECRTRTPLEEQKAKEKHDDIMMEGIHRYAVAGGARVSLAEWHPANCNGAALNSCKLQPALHRPDLKTKSFHTEQLALRLR
jgi:hypothetical protein